MQFSQYRENLVDFYNVIAKIHDLQYSKKKVINFI